MVTRKEQTKLQISNKVENINKQVSEGLEVNRRWCEGLASLKVENEEFS